MASTIPKGATRTIGVTFTIEELEWLRKMARLHEKRPEEICREQTLRYLKAMEGSDQFSK